MKKIFFANLILLILCAFVFAQTREVKEIKINSSWGGLGTPQKSELIIAHKPKGYYAGGDRVEKHLVDNLLGAIDEPEIKKFELANLGITQEWLDANAQAGIEDYAASYFSMSAPKQKQLYLSSFKNLQFIEKIIPKVLNGGWTDDYPSFGVEITEADGTKIIVGSDEQPEFMLPWEIVRNGKTTRTYNANISRALVALLPKKFANRDRLSGKYLRQNLAVQVTREIKDQWNYLDVENKAGGTLNTLQENYKVISAEINSNHGVDFGEEWGKDKTPETNVHMLLRKNDFPNNFAVNLKLTLQNEKVENLDIFQSKINKYQDLVFSVGWLKNFIETKNLSVELRFIKNRSFSEKAMKRFAADMNKIGRSALVLQVERQQENIALIGVGGGLEYYQSYWLVLPDKKVILWRYRIAFLLNWGEKDFETKECTDEISAGLKCVGAVISPGGIILSN